MKNRLKPILLLLVLMTAACQPSVGSDLPERYQSILSDYDDDPHGDLRAVVVVQGDEVVAERYYNSSDRDTLVDVRSAGKSVTSLLFGIAREQGVIGSVDDLVAQYWLEAEGAPVGSVRLADLLTMRSGLDADGNDPTTPGYEDFMDSSDDPLSWALTIPSAEEPGTQYRYNSLAAYTTGVVIARATGQNLEEFAREHLFGPLGIERLEWQEDRSGITKGQGNLFLTAPGFARIGQMVLNDGAYGGEQIVSSLWIEESLREHVDVSAYESNAVGYGYYWFRQIVSVHDQELSLIFASGNGGNKIYLIPAFDMVVAVTSTAYGQGRAHRRSEEILQAILETYSASLH